MGERTIAAPPEQIAMNAPLPHAHLASGGGATGGIAASFTKRYEAGPEIQAHELRLPGRAGITVLFGPSGSGKTTVLRCLAGLERPDEGTVCCDGSVWSDAARAVFVPPRRRHLGFVPQDYALFPHLSVERNIAYGVHDLSGPEQRVRVTELIRWLGLEGLEQRLPRALSGGQQQRVALARAVAPHPRWLLLDEPLSALDAPTRTRLRGDLRRLLCQLGIPTLLVTHDRLEAMALGDHLIVMDAGKIVQQGTVPDVFSRPASLAVAGIVAVETVHPGSIVERREGLVKVAVGHATLTAVDPDWTPETLEVYVCIRGEDVILTQAQDARSSPRNRLEGIVRSISPEGPMARVGLDCGFPLTALLTKQACEELSLREYDRVVVLIKAPHIHLIPHAGPY